MHPNYLQVHLVWVTKYQEQLLTEKIVEDLKVNFPDLCQSYETQLVEMRLGTRHVHLLLNYSPTLSVHKLANHLKDQSYRLLRKKYPQFKGGLWSSDYFCTSCDENAVKQYIVQQTQS